MKKAQAYERAEEAENDARLQAIEDEVSLWMKVWAEGGGVTWADSHPALAEAMREEDPAEALQIAMYLPDPG